MSLGAGKEGRKGIEELENREPGSEGFVSR